MSGTPWRLRTVKTEEYSTLYTSHIATSFPRNERPSEAQLLHHLERELQEILLMTDGERDVAFCVLAEANGIALVTLLAVYEGEREKGLGSVLLSLLRRAYADRRGILLEIEDSKDAENDADRAIRERRVHFYTRAGFQFIRGVTHDCFGVPLLPMALPLRDSFENIEKTAVADLTAAYHKILPESIWGRVVTRSASAAR